MHLVASDPSSTDVSWKPAAVFPQEAGKQFPAHSTIQLKVSRFVFLKELPSENALPVLLLSIQHAPQVPLMHSHQVLTHHPPFYNKPRTCITSPHLPFSSFPYFFLPQQLFPSPPAPLLPPTMSRNYKKVRLPSQLKVGLTKALAGFLQNNR